MKRSDWQITIGVGALAVLAAVHSVKAQDFVFGDFENGLDPFLDVVQTNGGPNSFNGSVPINVTRGSFAGSFSTAAGFQQYLRYNNSTSAPTTVLGQLGNYDAIEVDMNVPLGSTPSSFFVNEIVINSTDFGFAQSGNATPVGSTNADIKGAGTVTLAWNYVNGIGSFAQKLAAQQAETAGFFQVELVTNYGNGWDGNPFTVDNLRLTTIADWNQDNDGTWTPTSSWQEGLSPIHADSTANFGSVISSARTIMVDAPITVGTITFNNSNSYTIAGTNPITLSVTSQLPTQLIVSKGSHTISAPLTSNQNLLANVASGAALTLTALRSSMAAVTKQGGGTLSVNAVRASGLTINGGTLQVLANGGNTGVSNVGSLTIGAGTLDLVDNDMIVNYTGASPQATIRSYLVSGYNAGAWNGTGVASSAAAGNAAGTTALGYAEAADLGVHSFGGQPVNSAVLVKYTYYGDSNLDGKVDLGNDFSAFVDGLNGRLHGWEGGDYNYDGATDVTNDFPLFLKGFSSTGGQLADLENFIASDGSLSAGDKAQLLAAVPEPGALLTCTLIGVAAVARRRRKID